MNLVRQMMPGHNQCEITNSRMSDVERIVNDYLGLSMRGGTPMINGHYNEHSQHHYPRRTVGHDHLPERTVVHGNTFYIRHCVFDFGMNDLSFDFALSEDNHATFPFWPKEFTEDSLTVEPNVIPSDFGIIIRGFFMNEFFEFCANGVSVFGDIFVKS